MMKFFQSSDQGLIISVSGCGSCTGNLEGSKEITPNTVDAAKEKHLPVVSVNGKHISINVGSVAHPMTEEHLIATVILETKKGVQYKVLSSTEGPVAEFEITSDDQAVAAYAYCNLHGIWKVEI